MKRIIKIILSCILVAGLLLLWYRADEDDYFKGKYRDLSAADDIFPLEGIIWTQDKGKVELAEFYRQHFSDTSFIFPRQEVKTIKLFRNIPMFGVFTARTLKQENNNLFLKFCNDTANFSFGETTWEISDAEYYVRLYDKNNNVVGKLFLCIEDCGMTDARPFCPAMKYGGLSEVGLKTITNIINDKALWE